jgi:hypothetical protein
MAQEPTELEKDFEVWLAYRNALEWVPDGRGSAEKIRSIPFSEALAVWGLIKREGGEKLKYLNLHAHFYRFSVEHVSAMLRQDYTFELGDFLIRCRSGMAEYLDWKESELGKHCYRLGSKLVDEWAASKYGVGVKMLVEKMGEGSLKACEVLYRSIGKSDGTPIAPHQPIVELTKEYIIVDGKPKAIPMEIKIREN